METCNIHIQKDDIDLDVRKDFPMLNQDIVYLDSANTSLTPKCVIDDINEYLNNYEYNYNRGVNDLSFKINSIVNSTRKNVANFINASDSEIIFTNGATSSSKMLTNDIAIYYLEDNSEIILCKEDHYSTINPWLDLQRKFPNKNIKINEITINENGDYNEDELLSKINDNTKYIILTHIHNIYCEVADIPSLVKKIRSMNKNVKIVLDASQSISHTKVDVKELDVDYLYFSGHKMFATTGIGVLYIKDNQFKDFELGTLNILGVISLNSAINYIKSIGLEQIEKYIMNLTYYLYEQLEDFDEIIYHKNQKFCESRFKCGIIAFKLRSISTEEFNDILNDYKIYVRANNFCQTVQDDFIRISLNIYNNKKDIDKLIKVIKYIINN